MPPVLMHPVVPQPSAWHFPSFFNCFKFKIEMASVIKAGSAVNLMVEEVPSKCTVFASLCLALAILICH